MQLKNKILSIIFSLALLGPMGPSPAPQPAYAAGVIGTGFAEETLTVSNTALSITSTLCVVRGRQTPALIEVLDNAIYFTLDSPTATPDSSDYAAPAGTVISVNKANQIRMIRQSADTLVKVTCFRGGQLPTITSYDKSGTGVSGSGSTTIGPLEVVSTTHQTLATNAADGNGTVAAIDGMAMASVFIITLSTHDTAQDLIVEVSPDDATTWNTTAVFDLGAGNMRSGTITLGTGATTTTVLVDLHGMSDLRVRFNGGQTGNATAGNIVATSKASAIGETIFNLLTQYTDDASTHSPTVTTVKGIGLVAVPTDAAVDANDIGMPAMSLDRRANTDANLQIAGTDVTGGAGAVGATTPRVTLASDDPAVVDLASIQTAVEATQAAVEIMDDWDASNRVATSPIAGVTGVIGGSGIIGTTTQRVTIATDDEINDDIDAMRVSLAIIDAQVFGAGTEAAALRVTLPTDGTGVVNLGAVDNAVLDTIADGIAAELSATADITIQIADSDALGGSGTITAQVLRVNIATDDPVNDAAVETSAAINSSRMDVTLEATADVTVQMGDTDVAVGAPLFVRLSDGTAAIDAAVLGTATYTEATTTGSVIGGVRTDAIDTSLAGTTNEIAPFQMDANGHIRVTQRPQVLEGTTLLFNAGDITATNMGASTAVTVPTGTGVITQVCVVFTVGTITSAEAMTIFFFEADPTVSENTANMTQAEALLVVAKVDFLPADFAIEFATGQVACLQPNAVFTAITHALVHQTGATNYTDEIVNMRFWTRRDS